MASFSKVSRIIMQKNAGVQYVEIDPDYAGQRLDNFLLTRLKNVPKSHIYRIVRKGEVRVNKKRIDPNYRLQAGDIVRVPPLKLDVVKAPLKPSQSLSELLLSRVLYEDKGLIIINKPSGIPVHGGSKVNLGLVEALRNIYPKLPHLELVHRLDADTSGCLILAKKRSVLRELHEMMREGAVKKIYLALTFGHWQPQDYRVEAPLMKNHLSSGERIVKVDTEGKESLTVFEPIEKYENATLVEATLHTGRTHQIRVHAQYKKHPIAGDEKYGYRDFNKEMREAGLKRLFLHAHRLIFTLPSTGETIKVISPLDNDLQECLDNLSLRD